jgi:uracil phosphoribosyltransferase
MVVELGKENSIFNNFLSEVRDEKVQQDRLRFRRNMQRMSEILAYEVSKKLKYSPESITTPLGEATVNTMDDEVVVATILRAGLPMQEGIMNYFDHADAAFVSAYRKHKSGDNYDIEVEYSTCPTIDGKVLLIADPMLATGQSMFEVYKELLKNGTPKSVHVLCIIASDEGMAFIQDKLPKATKYWIGAIDHALTAQSYIVPGIGDAGDLAYGDKL